MCFSWSIRLIREDKPNGFFISKISISYGLNIKLPAR